MPTTHRPRRQRIRVIRIMTPEIHDGPWRVEPVVDGKSKAYVYAYVTDTTPGTPLVTQEVVANSVAATIPWLDDRTAWKVRRVSSIPSTLGWYRAMTVSTTGDVPPPAVSDPGENTPTVTLPDAGFHTEGWYTIQASFILGSAAIGYLQLGEANGQFVETIYWKTGFVRPDGLHTWTITWLGVQPNLTGYNKTQFSFVTLDP